LTYTFPVSFKNNYKILARAASLPYKSENALALFKTFSKKYAPDRKNNFQMRLGR